MTYPNDIVSTSLLWLFLFVTQWTYKFRGAYVGTKIFLNLTLKSLGAPIISHSSEVRKHCLKSFQTLGNKGVATNKVTHQELNIEWLAVTARMFCDLRSICCLFISCALKGHLKWYRFVIGIHSFMFHNSLSSLWSIFLSTCLSVGCQGAMHVPRCCYAHWLFHGECFGQCSCSTS